MRFNLRHNLLVLFIKGHTKKLFSFLRVLVLFLGDFSLYFPVLFLNFWSSSKNAVVQLERSSHLYTTLRRLIWITISNFLTYLFFKNEQRHYHYLLMKNQVGHLIYPLLPREALQRRMYWHRVDQSKLETLLNRQFNSVYWEESNFER